MAKQRVEFQLSASALRSGRIMQAAVDVFGERIRRWAYYEGALTVECDAEQFGLFIIKRFDCGATLLNEHVWRALNPKVLEPQARAVF